ncbi:DNA repair protein [Veronia nyctiphanis]|uniref:DNA repair protein n=1 Tax=Veronia nyctiphanis TaxID=1278244 RepID=A0A4Q0YUI3_9GAMM|nr:DNA repair protein [Veronia nyctiphanis]
MPVGYYSTLEKVGIHKRDIMAERVENASAAQQDAQETFTDALSSFSALTQFDGGELEQVYKTLNDKYEASEDAAEQVRSRIQSVEDVSDALFTEWEEELDLYSSPRLRRDSQAKLLKTRRSYQQMVSAMRKAENKMAPVLDTLRDNTLYLKHNLNAAAIGSLKQEFSGLKQDISVAIKDMKSAIAESERFLATLKQ